MDSLTHAAVGAAIGACFMKAFPARGWLPVGVGMLAGIAPDIDIFLRDPGDPLGLFRWHRHFTHGLVVQPLSALIVAGAVYGLSRLGRGAVKTGFRPIFLCALPALLMHVVVDLGTSFGTVAAWPFSEARLAWDILPIVDPLLLTLPLAVGAAIACKLRSRRAALWTLGWLGLYAAVGSGQHWRVESALAGHARAHGCDPVRIVVLPMPFSPLLWKGLYEADGRVHGAMLRAGAGPVSIVDLPSRPKADLSNLSMGAADATIRDFHRFTCDWMTIEPGPAGINLGDPRFGWGGTDGTPAWCLHVAPDGTCRMRFSSRRPDMRQYLQMQLGSVASGK